MKCILLSKNATTDDKFEIQLAMKSSLLEQQQSAPDTYIKIIEMSQIHMHTWNLVDPIRQQQSMQTKIKSK